MKNWTIIQQERFIYFFAIAASIALSAWLDVRETVINPDGICYVLGAEVIGKQGLFGAMQLCGQAQWPFYSLLIYLLVQMTHFSYVTAAYLWNTLFTLGTVSVFILLVKELGGSRRTLWFAALVILLAHGLNSAREYIIRDHGFWAFYLGSLFFLLRYRSTSQWQFALAWSVSLFIATLFRIEGAVFLLVMPFTAFFDFTRAFKARCQSFFVMNQVTFLLGFLLVLYLLLHPEKTLNKLGRMSEVLTQIQHGFQLIAERYHHTRAMLAHYVLPSDSVDDAGTVLLLLLIAWYLLSVITNLTWGYALLVVYCWQQKALQFKKGALLTMVSYLVTNIAITLVFLLEHLFLSKRYLIALTLVFMLFVPFALDKLAQQSQLLRQRLFLYLMSLCILFSGMGGVFDFGYSKAYLHQAGDWLANNVPETSKLYVNDYQLMYYSQHFGDTIFKKVREYRPIDNIAQGGFKQYDYIALRLSKKTESKVAEVIQEMQLTPSQIFSNKRGDRVVIYKVK